MAAPPTSPLPRAAATFDGESPRWRTRHDLPESARRDIVRLLNDRLAEAIDLQSMCKQAHWNVRGPQFISLHELFDLIGTRVAEYADTIAERIEQLDGSAEGTTRIVARRSTLPEYPATIRAGSEHLTALARVLAQSARSARACIEEMNAHQDAVSADILTELARGFDRWLWMVDAHGSEG